MDFAIQVCFYVVGIPLELLAISAMLRGGYRRYPFVFAYVVALFLTTIVEMPTSLAYYSGDKTVIHTLVNNYYRDEGILQVTVFALVISLIYSATPKLASRRIVRFGLVAGASIFAMTSFVLH